MGRLFLAIIISWYPALAGYSKSIRTETVAGGKIYIITQISTSYKIDSARYGVFIPDGIDTIQGVFIHQHGCTMEGRGLSTAHDLQYQAFAKKWKLAIIGPDLYAKANCHDWKDPSSGSAAALFKTLEDIGMLTGHKELLDAPWLLWGHSGGGYWSQAMMTAYPERVLALFSYSPGLKPEWEYNSKTSKIPIMIRHAGPEGDACCWLTALKTFHQLRQLGSYVSIAYTSYQNHNYSYVRYMAIPFFEAALLQRLPKGKNTSYKSMGAMDATKAWLAETATLNIYPAATYPKNKLNASWFPDSLTAAKWREYVITGTIVDRTPPPAPFALQMNRRHNVTVSVSWKADADIESGISHFNIYRDNQFIARFPSSGAYQSFDTNGDDAYPITLPPLQTDITLLWNDAAKISISTVNHFGMESVRTVMQ
jgi:pimeloyl-ACP methyl ester carboxylesterase